MGVETQSFGSVAQAYVDAADTLLNIAISANGSGFISVELAFWDSIVGTWTFGEDSSSYTGGRIRNTSVANADKVSYKVFLAKGTYSISLISIKSTGNPIIDILIDGVSQGTVDTYAAAGVYNQKDTITGVTIATAGIKIITLLVNGKNAASSGYSAYLQALSLWRTA